MSLGTLLLVGLAGSVGALARYGVDHRVGLLVGKRFPWGILAINLSGTLLLGLFVGAALSSDAYRLAGTALLGAYTTFSAVVGVDDEVGSNGSVAFEVWVDGVLKASTPVLTGASAGVPLTVAVGGAGSLRLVATSGGDGVSFDHADWADAKVG